MSEAWVQGGFITRMMIEMVFASIGVFFAAFGRYCAAKLIGVRVERFFIGASVFGLAIEKKYKDTMYGIGILPLGASCSLAGENYDPRKERCDYAQDELRSKSLWGRGFVASLGVVMLYTFLGILILIDANLYDYTIPSAAILAGLSMPVVCLLFWGVMVIRSEI